MKRILSIISVIPSKLLCQTKWHLISYNLLIFKSPTIYCEKIINLSNCKPKLLNWPVNSKLVQIMEKTKKQRLFYLSLLPLFLLFYQGFITINLSHEKYLACRKIIANQLIIINKTLTFVSYIRL